MAGNRHYLIQIITIFKFQNPVLCPQYFNQIKKLKQNKYLIYQKQDYKPGTAVEIRECYEMRMLLYNFYPAIKKNFR